MTFEFDSIDDAHFISSFRAFVHDNGMPGVRLKKDDGSFVNIVFSPPGIHELQKQLVKARKLMESIPKNYH